MRLSFLLPQITSPDSTSSEYVSSKGELRFRVALLGGDAIPFHGLGEILRDVFAVIVHNAELELRFNIARLGDRKVRRDAS